MTSRRPSAMQIQVQAADTLPFFDGHMEVSRLLCEAGAATPQSPGSRRVSWLSPAEVEDVRQRRAESPQSPGSRRVSFCPPTEAEEHPSPSSHRRPSTSTGADYRRSSTATGGLTSPGGALGMPVSEPEAPAATGFDLAKFTNLEAFFEAEDLQGDHGPADLLLRSIDLDEDDELAHYFGARTPGADWRRKQVAKLFVNNTSELEAWANRLDISKINKRRASREKKQAELMAARGETPTGIATPRASCALATFTPRGSQLTPRATPTPRGSTPRASQLTPRASSALATLTPRASSALAAVTPRAPSGRGPAPGGLACRKVRRAQPHGAGPAGAEVGAENLPATPASWQTPGGGFGVSEALLVKFGGADRFGPAASEAAQERAEESRRRLQMVAVQQRSAAAAQRQRLGQRPRAFSARAQTSKPPSGNPSASSWAKSAASTQRRALTPAPVPVQADGRVLRSGSPAQWLERDSPIWRHVQRTDAMVQAGWEFGKAMTLLAGPSPPPPPRRAKSPRARTQEDSGSEVSSNISLALDRLAAKPPRPPDPRGPPAAEDAAQSEAGSEASDEYDYEDDEDVRRVRSLNFDAQVVHLVRLGDMARLKASGAVKGARPQALRTALFAAAHAGSAGALAILLSSQSADVHWREAGTEQTVLHIAAAADHLEACACLEELGADVRATDAKGRAPWEVAGAAAAAAWEENDGSFRTAPSPSGEPAEPPSPTSQDGGRGPTGRRTSLSGRRTSADSSTLGRDLAAAKLKPAVPVRVLDRLKAEVGH